MVESSWLDGPPEEQSQEKQFTERERDLLTGATPLQVRAYGNLDQETAEIMLVSYFVTDPSEGDSPSTVAAEDILEANLSGRMFENKNLGMLFDEVTRYYKNEHKPLTYDNASLIWMNAGLSRQDASGIKLTLTDCKAVTNVRRFDPKLVVEFFLNHHLQKQMDRIYKQGVTDRNDPAIGPQEAWKRMRESCIRDLVDPRGAVLRVTDWMESCEEEISWLQDMKANPEKYMGYYCGIKGIDANTKGFRKGQLTIFVGATGGCKTMLMLNVAIGLWERGYNVLFVSLEMEDKIIKLKFWCRATGEVSYSKAYGGLFSHPEDWAIMEKFQAALQAATSDTERNGLIAKIERYKQALNKGKGNEDAALMRNFKQKFEHSRKNRLKVMNSDQSCKMRLSQLDRWLREEAYAFKPDVVIVDYLDLVAPENPNPNRPDIGYGDICKMLRAMGKQMGFSPVSAAQLNRQALGRMREMGLDSPDKAMLDTDDISGSQQIGNDADNVFILWRKPGNSALQMFASKVRYGEKDTTKGVTLQIDFESNTISDSGIEDIKAKNEEKSTADIWSVIPEASHEEKLLPGQEGFDPEQPAEGPSLDLTPEGDDDIWGKSAEQEREQEA